ncbi:MAG: SMC family ATPase [Candidatus Bathyarchaeota archaeon]|jgi:exonuclease SbcC|nr:SMC family ATPase [Candidatus Bathyarchaeota archaeon A05DMB-5]MDH7557870.1 SMC family ATPase [Candidatus Bathyarchaeota archaeon]
MKIEIVQLENIRSHVKSTVPFAKGFNCLVGGLGCGKSSILYSIDFALFGDPIGRSYDYLLREGANHGKVTLQFTQNGKNYKITRGLKKRGKGTSQDFDELKLFEGENLIASIKSDAVAEQLKAITGLDKELFREIVWVRQEHLKELLDATSRDRQKRLDELFGLSDYEEAWSNLLGYEKEYEGEKKAYEKDPDIVGMEKISQEYNQTAEEFSLAEIEIEETAKKLNTAKKTLEEAELTLKRLEEVKNRIEELKRKEAQIQANLSNTEDTLSLLTRRINEKKIALDNFKQHLATMETQIKSHKAKLKEAGIDPNQPIETLRQQLTSFDERITTLKGEQEATLKGIREDQKRISSLSTENRCPLCLQTLNEEYKNNLTQKIQKENTERQKTIAQLQNEIEQLQQIKAIANNAFSNIQTLTLQADNIRTNITKEEDALTEFYKEFEEKQRLTQDLQLQLETVKAEISMFDMSELETARTRREQAFRQYYSLDSELRTKENRKKELTRRLDEIKERIDQAQHKIERMEKITKTIEIIGGIREAYRSIQPKLRAEFVKVLRNFVQQVLDALVGGEGPLINVLIDETYTPYVKSESGVEREVSHLSGGERTLLAFAYRLGLGQLIMQSRTGHGLSMLLLDEPTESLGREDGSINRLAEAISRFKAIEQIIAVTHSEAFAEKAEHVIRLEKEAGESRVSVEK